MVLKPSKSRVPFLISLFNFQGPIAEPLSRTAQRVYHIPYTLVNTFLKVFQIFFKIFSFHLSFDFFLAPSGSSLESSYILSSHSPFVNTFYKLFCHFCTISFHFSIPSRAFLCARQFVPLYVGSPPILIFFCLYVGMVFIEQLLSQGEQLLWYKMNYTIKCNSLIK